MNLAVVIVGYNSRKYLKDCLNSLHKSSTHHRVYFVDNASRDDSVGYVRENYRSVTIISSKVNLGFAGGNNLGIKAAISDGAEYIFLLNPDTIIKEDCLERLLESADERTILQPLILLHEANKKTSLINTTGNHLNFLGFSYCSDYKKPQELARAGRITSASGAAMLIPAKIIRAIGSFDESFFMYHEDLDLCFRARLNGFECSLIPKAVVWHKYSFSKNKQKLYYVERNRLLFLYKNFSFKYLALILPSFLINELLMLVYAAANLWLGKKLYSYIDAFKLTKQLSKDRRKNLSNRKVTESELKRFIKAPILFSEVGLKFLFLPYNALLRLYWNIVYFFV